MPFNLASGCLVVSLALTVAAGLAAQRGGAQPASPRPSQPVAREMSVEYKQLIDRFLGGEAEAAVNIVKDWQVTSVQAVQDVQAWDRVTLRAAALLETDAALARSREAIRRFGSPHPRSRTSLDMGSRLTLALGWLDLADKIRPHDKSPFRRQWQVAVGRALLREDHLSLADMILGDAILVFPNDPDVLLTYGTVRETAGLRFTADVTRSIRTPSGPTLFRGDWVALLDDARSVLERALRAAPDSHEAQLRLASVRMQQRNDGAAGPLLDELNAARPTPDIAYLAALMRGRIAERRGDLQAAVKLYQEARQLVPNAQSALIAHAQALRASSHSPESVAVIRQILMREISASDPWARYPLGLDEARASLDPLRDQVEQQRSPAATQTETGQQKAVDAGETFEVTENDTSGRIVLDVLVTRDHRPVTGLSADEFDVRYGDVRQSVELIDAQSLPIDVRITIDTGAGLEGDLLAPVAQAVRGLTSRLRPTDRAELITFSQDIRLAAGLTTDRERLSAAIDQVAPAQGTALFDAAFTTIALPSRPGRRTLVVVFTAGLDTGSWLLPTTTINSAAAAPAIIYGVITPDPDLPLRQSQLDVDRVRKWLFNDPMLLREAFLPVLADETGGEVLHPATKEDLPATFADVLARFQERYRLAVTPAGARKAGLHAIDVRMKDRALTVHARKRG